MDGLALRLASSSGEAPTALPVLRRLIEAHRGVLAACDREGNSLLHCAARSGNTEAVALLCSECPQLLDARNLAGVTPLEMVSGTTIPTVTSSGSGSLGVPLTASAERALRIRMVSTAAARGQVVELLRRAGGEEPIAAAPCASLANEATDDEDGASPALCRLPEELTLMVLMQLDGPLSLLRLRRCCRRMKEAADSEAVWERLCWTTYKVTRSSFLVGCAKPAHCSSPERHCVAARVPALAVTATRMRFVRMH